jgi:DEAD/DEAH box helicase domain-containing protein
LGKAAIFIYDGYPEGVGLAERAYEVIQELLEAVLSMLESCDCEEGCPGCIHSPKCGSGNKPLDKHGAILVLKALLGRVSPHELGVVIDGDQVEADTAVEASSETQWEASGPRALFFDIETQKTAEEVGGWENKHLMRLSLAVVYDVAQDIYRHFYEDQVDQLVRTLLQADLVVGFNIRKFDYRVLSAYTAEDLNRVPTFDILEDVKRLLGFRLSLDHLATHTLGERKTADGLQAVAWFREGRMDALLAYCKQDVALTRRLFEFGSENHFILYETREGQVVRLPVEWDLHRILHRIKEAS